MTYTARATLEIGSGSVCSGRAVTTTTPSNQVRTPRLLSHRPGAPGARPPRHGEPRGPNLLTHRVHHTDQRCLPMCDRTLKSSTENERIQRSEHRTDDSWPSANYVDHWYKSLSTNYTDPLHYAIRDVPTDPINSNSTNIIENNFISPFTRTSRHNNSPDFSLKHNINNSNIISELPEYVTVNELKTKESLNFSEMRHPDEGAHGIVDSFEYDMNCDMKLKKKYRDRVGNHLAVPKLSDSNPRNIRPMSIAQPLSDNQQSSHSIGSHHMEKHPQETKQTDASKICCNEMDGTNTIFNDVQSELNNIEDINSVKSSQIFYSSTEDNTWLTKPRVGLKSNKSQGGDVELTDVKTSHSQKSYDSLSKDSFTEYVSKQQKLLESIGNSEESNIMTTACNDEKVEICQELNIPESVTSDSDDKAQYPTEQKCSNSACEDKIEILRCANQPEGESTTRPDEHEHSPKSDRIILTQLPNNAYIFLTLPKPLVSPSNSNVNTPVQIIELENTNDIKPPASESNSRPNIVKKKRQKMAPEHPACSDTKKSALDKNVLKVLLFESLFKNNANENLVHNSGVSAITNHEVGFPLWLKCFVQYSVS